MRIIAGEHKGRQLKSVPGKMTRPTTDKVKEAVFQVIGPFFQGGIVLDLFAGSGGLGIEALSRGMDKAVFVDKQPKAIHTIYENIKQFGLEERVEVFRADAYRAMQAAAKRNLQFDLVLLDPPYKKVHYENLLHELIKLDLLKPEARIYCEHDLSEKLPTDLREQHLEIVKQSNYGGTIGITIYKKN
ncbi:MULTISPECIES: 16S rRNA (guanine(966)-N(2))-methyltransferase RsmD [Virgibacillus]|uniref:Ribosomal RNA small subunit methyltransferase D n=2 Tax=Virgibacillus TaxID=84406 RepID=A0A024QE32_9BACI|nr:MULTISPECIES: 16S rRNA (guanine(966)-N(2))-methyltransferase RsmD [Virgibacillus]EQB36528.1 hypothetical protein M948_15970 [Virgibacillus sp. CM-4]MYL42362.1 16S rRNA (guanine(966)-N(2))-methyltransferase RsmD [Virgibacillus massiliensis]GGJ43185.1 rRNA methyltransferase [Virgibacillus kapii]CDQ40226.1 Ribosomal RNA small subunit methyltransferase D [Virgibacillus massiliensis]